MESGGAGLQPRVTMIGSGGPIEVAQKAKVHEKDPRDPAAALRAETRPAADRAQRQRESKHGPRISGAFPGGRLALAAGGGDQRQLDFPADGSNHLNISRITVYRAPKRTTRTELDDTHTDRSPQMLVNADTVESTENCLHRFIVGSRN